MMRLLPLALLVPTLLMAQASDPASTDTIFVRAQRMVAEGQGDAGRALVQQQLDAAPAGSPKYVEALYWRAALASTAADAERDLKRIVIEYALSPRADDALMRLAQLEMARGDRDQALAHLQRVVTEHPKSPSRARASYWMARTLFEQKKDVPGCTRLTDARSNAAAGDVELRNQIDYYAPRCESVDAANATAATAAPTAVSSSASTPAPPRPQRRLRRLRRRSPVRHRPRVRRLLRTPCHRRAAYPPPLHQWAAHRPAAHRPALADGGPTDAECHHSDAGCRTPTPSGTHRDAELAPARRRRRHRRRQRVHRQRPRRPAIRRASRRRNCRCPPPRTRTYRRQCRGSPSR